MLFLVEDLSDANHVLRGMGAGCCTRPLLHRGEIKKFRERGKAGVTKELSQMHDTDIFYPVARELLSKEERVKALALLMFL